MSDVLMECRNLTAGYGSLAAVRDLDLTIGRGELVALIGPNGAGKTTTLLTMAGELEPLGGEGGGTARSQRRQCIRAAATVLDSSPRNAR